MTIKKESLISVILSVKNDEKNIEKSIRSILNQTYSNIELLLCDDCSTDNTLKVIENISDKRIKLYQNQTNLGLTKSLNKLIQSANGNYIARQDSDDYSYPKRIEKQFEFLKKYELDACNTRAKIANTNKSIPNISSYFPPRLIMKFKNPFLHGTLFIKKEVLYAVGLYNENYKYAQDYKLYKDLFANNYKIKMLREVLYTLNTEDNISTNFKKEQEFYFNLAKKS